MDEPLFAALAEQIAMHKTGVVLASVLQTRGSTPRRVGSRMLVSTEESTFSIGGGALEGRVIAAAREVLASGGDCVVLEISLSGGAQADGVCGGVMRIGLRRWCGARDLTRAQSIASELAAGRSATLRGAEQGAPEQPDVQLQPNPRLLIVGAGHCGQALCRAAAALDLQIWVHDERAEHAVPANFPHAARVGSDPAMLRQAADTARPLYAVLLNRDYQSDLQALQILLPLRPAFLGMMGSRRRIAVVRDDPQLAAHAPQLAAIYAPIGLEIGAHTPAEIAVSILAQVIAYRHGSG